MWLPHVGGVSVSTCTIYTHEQCQCIQYMCLSGGFAYGKPGLEGMSTVRLWSSFCVAPTLPVTPAQLVGPCGLNWETL